MGKITYGWVETTSQVVGKDPDEEIYWQGLIRIPTIIDCIDEVGLAIFGGPYSGPSSTDGLIPWVDNSREGPPIAKGRGLPVNPNYLVELEVARHEKFLQQFPKEDPLVGHTWIDYEELKTHNLHLHPGLKRVESGWWVLFKMIDTFQKENKWNNGGVRIVIWFGE